jgi:hypothetical protein
MFLNKTGMKDSIRYPLIILTGFLFGIFVFLPINELTSYYEYKMNSGVTVWQFILDQFIRAITLKTPVKFIFYLLFGGLMGSIFLFSLITYKKRNFMIFQLRNELDKNLIALIEHGEDDNLEFKSSFRYDYRQQKPNKALESVIIKTIAGFMNTRGGSLLIGVGDSGDILGLEPDFNTLSRKDSDGYTQLLMSTISEKIGTPACRLVRILFHRHEEKEVCRIIILPSPLPVYVNESNQSHFYVRTGSGTREMDVQEAITFIKTKWG